MWAWAPWRVRKMRRNVDLGICKLPFEKNWLEQRGCQAEYVGHPFFDEMQRQRFDTGFEQQILSDLNGNDLVTLLPGSRKQELNSNLPAFLKTARLIAKTRPETRFAISCLDESQKQRARKLLSRRLLQCLPVKKSLFMVEKLQELIRIAKCCLACSGSVLWN